MLPIVNVVEKPDVTSIAALAGEAFASPAKVTVSVVSIVNANIRDLQTGADTISQHPNVSGNDHRIQQYH